MGRLLPVLFLPLALLAEEAPKPLEELVNGLGDPRIEVRDQASEALAKRGEEARAALEKASESEDAEVKARAQDLLRRLEAKRPPAEPVPQEQDPKPGKTKRAVAQRIMVGGGGGAKPMQMDWMNGKDLELLQRLKGRTLKPLLATCADAPEELLAQLKLDGGALVREVSEGSPLAVHDLVVAVNGKPVARLIDLEALLEEAEPPVQLTVLRRGERITVKLE